MVLEEPGAKKTLQQVRFDTGDEEEETKKPDSERLKSGWRQILRIGEEWREIK